MCTGLNYYDISRPCGDPESLCYPVIRYIVSISEVVPQRFHTSTHRTISHFLDRSDIRATLGVDRHISEKFSACSATVGSAFDAAGDQLHSSMDYVGALLERRVRVLIYVGTYDWICNWIGNEAWTLALDWHGREDFAAVPLRAWRVDGQVAGKTRSAHGLTFATVDAAGHMVR
jgi:carboxypeptidase C (cathepsin A)